MRSAPQQGQPVAEVVQLIAQGGQLKVVDTREPLELADGLPGALEQIARRGDLGLGELALARVRLRCRDD